MNRFTKAVHWLIILSATTASISVLLQWRSIRELRVRNTESRATAESLLPANEPMAETNKVTSEELEQLRRQNQDLLRLRNQVRELRSQIPELATARQENERLLQARQRSAAQPIPAAPPDPAQFIQKDALTDLGLATPEAAIQSFFHAMRDGDARRSLECMTVEFRNRRTRNPPTEENLAIWGEQLKQEMQEFRNFRIVSRKDLSPQKVLLGLQSSEGPTVLEMPLVLVGNEWKVDPPF